MNPSVQNQPCQYNAETLIWKIVFHNHHKAKSVPLSIFAVAGLEGSGFMGPMNRRTWDRKNEGFGKEILRESSDRSKTRQSPVDGGTPHAMRLCARK